MLRIETLIELDDKSLNNNLNELNKDLKESFDKCGNQVLLQEENDILKELSLNYDLTLEDVNNKNLIKEILLKQEMLVIQNREIENLKKG